MSGAADVMKTANYKFPNLETQVARSLLPTPNTSDANNANMKNNHDIKKGYLRGIVHLLPTPIADDAKNVNLKENRFPTLTSKVKATEGSGALNPTWVEWLMGYPEGWTDCED